MTNGHEYFDINFISSSHVETVVLLRGEKVDSHIDVDLYDLPPFTPLGHSFMFLLQNVNFVPGSKCSKKKCSVSKTRVFVLVFLCSGNQLVFVM